MKEQSSESKTSVFHEHRQTKAVVHRLSRIEGHVRAIKRMVEEEKACPDILIQLAAVKAAVKKTAQIVLEDHIESCLMQAASKGQTQEELNSLKEALNKYLD